MWHCSLWLSITALINSTQLRMLGLLPDSVAEADRWTDEELRGRLKVVLRSRQSGDEMEKSVWLLWTWQSPLMLMSWAWVCFIVGYTAHLVEPLVRRRAWTNECSVCIPLGAWCCEVVADVWF